MARIPLWTSARDLALPVSQLCDSSRHRIAARTFAAKSAWR